MPFSSTHPVAIAIEKAAKKSGRNSKDVTLIAVSKTFPQKSIKPFLSCGLRHFGENRVQEAQEKWPALKKDFAHVSLHLLGPLQTNKARMAVELFDVIHTLDRPKLARHLSHIFEETEKKTDCFIQINTGKESQKSGIFPEEADDFIDFCMRELTLPIVGIMGLPPLEENPAPHFGLLRIIAERNNLKRLSMGMSHDYPQAIELGATDIRVGSALFGERPSASYSAL